MIAAEKFWILDPLYAALGQLLAWFYAVIPSYGVAIMLLTVAVCVLRMPLVAKQVKSQAEMQKIQPELKRIQSKYKDDPQKRNEEMMKLYKEHSVNPFAGCLPLLLQMPLFIVLYRLILNLSREEGPKHIPTSSELYRSLVESGGRMKSFGMDLAEKASEVKAFGTLWPYLLVIGLVLATGFYQQRQMTSRMPKDGANQQMLLMTKIIPFFLAIVSWSIPAGVVLYFLMSNIWQIGQQAFLFRRKDAAAAAEEAARPAKGKGGGGSGGGGSGGGSGGRSPGGSGAPGADGELVPGPSAPAAGGGFFARLAKAMGTPEGGAPATAGESRRAGGGGGATSSGGRRGATSSGGRAGGRPGASNGRASRASSGGGSSGGRSNGSGGKASGGKASGGRSGTNGRVTPRGSQSKGGTKSRNSRRGK